MRKNRLGTFLEKIIFRPKNQKIRPGHLHPLDHGLEHHDMEHHSLEAPNQRNFFRKSRFSAWSRFEEARKMENEQRDATRPL